MYSLAVTNGTISDEQVSELFHQALADPQFNGQRILVLIPDGTRTAPIPQMFRLLHQQLGKRVAALDFLIALGTHNPMSEAGVLAHSTHLKGMGTFDPIKGEQARIRVTLATGISPERCAAHNLNYRDPATIQPGEWANREDEGILLVSKAGEILYRLK